MIPAWKIKRLIQAGDDFKCHFYLPPFNGDITEGSFDINEFKETKEFQDFIIHIKSLDVPFEYAKYRDRIFLAIKVK